MSQQYIKLPSELAAEILASNLTGKGQSGEVIAQWYEQIFKKILDCKKEEFERRGEFVR